MTEQTAIPRPRGLPVLGNALDVHLETRLEDMMRLSREHWPLFELSAFGQGMIVVSGHDLVDELCDESRFGKLVPPALQALKPISGNGLFTADTDDPVWRQAHHILMPAFSPPAVREMVPTMGDPLSQLLLKWARLNPGESINLTQDMTRLTLETIGLCAFGYRFNSFYREEPHPFVRAMGVAGAEAQRQTRRPNAVNSLDRVHQRRYEQAATAMTGLVDRIIRERKAAGVPPEPRDLLDHMLAGVDSETGEGLSDENIRYQIVTFLVAGHETTGGLLSFTIYELIKNPDVLARAYEEVDRALGDDTSALPGAAELGKLGFVEQLLKESLRKWPTAPAFFLHPLVQEATIGGRYHLGADATIMVLSPMHHRDPAVWGEDPERFDPDRFSPEAEAALPANAWKPFGNGVRACIGRHFALTEATLALASILQRFELVDYANYTLKVRWYATMKPEGMTIQVRPRAGRTPGALIGVRVGGNGQAEAVESPTPAVEAAGQGTPLLVLYGSNLGTSEGLARRIAADGGAAGFAATVAPLDDYVERLPLEGATIVVTSSYNGQPPDNAVQFVKWLENGLLDDALAGVRYAVFGCGDHNWAATFQAVPTKIDEALEAHGASRIADRGAADASDDFDGQFRSWYRTFWTDVADALGLESEPEARAESERFEVEVLEHPGRYRFFASIGAQPLTVVKNEPLLGANGGGGVHLIELALPPGIDYRPGDHVAVLPLNDVRLVNRAAARFGLPLEARVRLHASQVQTQLPLDQPLFLGQLLAGFTELQEPATRAQIEVLAEWAENPEEQATLRGLAADEGIERYREEILKPRRSLIDLLEDYPNCQPPLDVFLSLIPELRPRFYSIASAPDGSDQLSLVVGVVEGPARSGHGTYRGTCSNFLAAQPPGATLFGFVRRPGIPFWPPEDPAVPMIMVATGTGLAPFRGFLQQREAQGESQGPAFLFYGCRDRGHRLFSDELDRYAEAGVASVDTAYSEAHGQPRTYVQDRIRERESELWALLEGGAIVYVCGHAAHVAPAVRQTFVDIYRKHTGASEEEGASWLQGLRDTDRYLEDIWAAA